MGWLFNKLNSAKKYLEDLFNSSRETQKEKLTRQDAIGIVESYKETNSCSIVKEFDFLSNHSIGPTLEFIEKNLNSPTEVISSQETVIEKESYVCERKKIPWISDENNFHCLWKYISQSRQKITNEHLSLPIIELGLENSFHVLRPETVIKRELSEYILVENGEIVCNFGNLKAIQSKTTSVYLHNEKTPALTSIKNYVFQVNTKLANPDFLYLVFKSIDFAIKLSEFAYTHRNQLQRILPWKKLKDLEINFPELVNQEKIVNRLRNLEILLKDRTAVNKKLEEWIEKNYEMLRKGAGGRTEKGFDELFEIVKETDKLDLEHRFYCLTFINSKFISAETNVPFSKFCAYCDKNPCSADILLLSSKVYETEKQKYQLKLYIGCDGYANSPRFIPIRPKPEIGIPYGYCLLFSHLAELITTIPGATTKRTIDQKELRKCKFFVHSATKIKKFNKECTPAFKSQQIIEEEIYRFTKYKEEEEKAINMCTFLRQIHW